MTKVPERIRLSRAKGWRKPEGVIVVARPTKWGNPFVIGEAGVPDAAAATELYGAAIVLREYGRRCLEAEPSMLHNMIAECLPGLVPSIALIRQELRGRDLACWCALDAPCHGDVLLQLANRSFDA